MGGLLNNSIPAIYPQVHPGDIATRRASQEHHRAHQVLWIPHPALRDQAGPLGLQVWSFAEDLLGSVGGGVSSVGKGGPEKGEYSAVSI